MLSPNYYLEVGTPAPRVSLTGANLSDSTPSTTDAEVSYQLNSSGAEQSYVGTGSAYSTIDTWLLSGVASDYDCQLTWVGSTLTGSAINTWLSCGSTQSWTMTETSAGSGKLGSGTIKIRDATTLVELASGSVVMSAQKSE